MAKLARADRCAALAVGAFTMLLCADSAPIAYSPLAQFDSPGSVPTDITLSIRASAGSPNRTAAIAGRRRSRAPSNA